MRDRFEASRQIEPRALAARFAAAGRVQVADFLRAGDAARLRAALCARTDWRHVVSAGATVFEIAATALDAMPPAQKAALERALNAEATHGFRFRYDLIRVPDARPAEADDLLTGFARFMSRPATLDLLRAITGDGHVTFADAQATRYRAGDFLTRHDDDVAGKDRRIAYVLGLTPDWAAEWGGLLLFNRPDGSVAEALVPRFNTLNLFAVPQPHSVSYVAPYAGAARLAVTGWLRGGTTPGSAAAASS